MPVSRLVLHLQYRSQLLDRKPASIICSTMAPGNTLASTKRFRGKCKWLRPWWVCHGEIYDEVKTMCKAETAKFWWSRAFAGVKSRAMARARGKGKGKVNGPEAKGKGKGTGEVHTDGTLEDGTLMSILTLHLFLGGPTDLEDTLEEDLEDTLEGDLEDTLEEAYIDLEEEAGLEWYRPEWRLRRGGC